jgi:hypothetical protein
VIRAKSLEDEHASVSELEALIPAEHRAFLAALLERHGVHLDEGAAPRLSSRAAERGLVDVALAHGARLLVDALGPVPPDVVQRCQRGSPWALRGCGRARCG